MICILLVVPVTAMIYIGIIEVYLRLLIYRSESRWDVNKDKDKK